MDVRTEPGRAGDSAGDDNGRRRIGEIFVELGFVTSEQLEAALVVQRRTGARIGEILVEQGSLTRLDLASALAEHWEPHRPGPDERPISLAEIGPAVAFEPQPDAESPASEDRAELEGGAHRDQPRLGFGRRRRAEAEAAAEARLAPVEDRLAGVEARLGGLTATFERLEAARAADAVATGARLKSIESTLARLERAESRLQEVDAQLLDLSVRVDRTARDGHDRAVGLAEELRLEAVARTAEVRDELRAGDEELLALREALAEARGALEGLRLEGERAATALRSEVTSLSGRVDDLLALRAADAALSRSTQEHLRTDVTALTQRLEHQAAVAEEQARATELAVRKGLASLGKRILLGESGSKEGKGLRRSIDRLGAAIVEADARADGRIPAVAAEGYVAFVPTPAGYRLVVRSEDPPEPGATVDFGEGDGPLVVVRYGRSPLPFDARPCAYLDFASP
jgi:hypothetical protein